MQMVPPVMMMRTRDSGYWGVDIFWYSGRRREEVGEVGRGEVEGKVVDERYRYAGKGVEEGGSLVCELVWSFLRRSSR